MKVATNIANESIETLPEVCGIYSIWEDGVCLYVGKSWNVRRRAMEHLNRWAGDWFEFRLELNLEVLAKKPRTEGEPILNYLEASLIYQKKPTENKNRPDACDLLHLCPENFIRFIYDKMPTI